MKLPHPVDTAKVGNIDFYVCHETRAAPHMWLYVINTTTYLSLVTLYYSFWLSPMGW